MGATPKCYNNPNRKPFMGQNGSNDAWRGFDTGRWQREINVRDFIVSNVTPYTSGAEFLCAPTPRTKAVWEALQPSFKRN